MGELFNPVPASPPPVVTILAQDQASQTVAEGIYLLSAVVPANSLTNTSGALVLVHSSTILSKVGGSLQSISQSNMSFRNSTGGVPNAALSYNVIFNNPGWEGYNSSGTLEFGLLPNALANLTLSACGFFTLVDAPGFPEQYNQCLQSYNVSTAPEAIGQQGWDEGIQPSVDWTQEVLFQLVLVEKSGADSTVPPKNFSSSSNPINQILLVN